MVKLVLTPRRLTCINVGSCRVQGQRAVYFVGVKDPTVIKSVEVRRPFL